MPTVATSSTSYCTPTQLLNYVDWTIVADCLRDGDAPPPLKATALNSASTAGALLSEICLSASGELESACLARELYSVADLQALTGATAAYLRKVVAGLALMQLFSRRMPITGKPEDIPAVNAAREALKLLADGKHIFGLADQREAGAGFEPITVADTIRTNQRYTVTAASRFFGFRQTRQ